MWPGRRAPGRTLAPPLVAAVESDPLVVRPGVSLPLFPEPGVRRMPPPVDAVTGDLRDVAEGPREECGVFGIYAPGEDVATLTYYALYALQHRGQESAGIAVSDGERILVHKDMGLVNQVFTPNGLAAMQGQLAIGHTRYSTTGSSSWANAQPQYRETPDRRRDRARATTATSSTPPPSPGASTARPRTTPG